MKITLTDGTILRKPWGFNTGYVACGIELDGIDAQRMLEHMQRNPRDFLAHLAQFAGRFRDNRIAKHNIDVEAQHE